jgi:hypothetical protein
MSQQKRLRRHFENMTGVKTYRVKLSRADTLLFIADVPEDMSVLSEWLKVTGLKVVCNDDKMYVIAP